jgi:hypothetical protein
MDKTISTKHTPGATSSGKKSCQKCRQPLSGQYVRTAGGLFHVGCFRCSDCGSSIVEQYYAIPDTDPVILVCERDYFARHDSLCAKCNEPLRGPHVSALGKKFHMDHFCCSACNKTFQADDVYFEHDGKILCQLHYLQRVAPPCAGCKMQVLGQVIEITRDNKAEQWHPDCYSLHTRWNIELGQASYLLAQAQVDTQEELSSQQKSVETFITHATDILDAFEESTAECINNIIHFSYANAQKDAIEQCARLIVRVQSLLIGLQDVLSTCERVGYPMPEIRDSRILSQRVQDFFAALSHNSSSGSVPSSRALLTMVSELASSIKLVLTRTFRLSLVVDEHAKATGLPCVNSYLEKLQNSAGKTLARREAREIEDKMSTVPTVKRQLSVNVNAILALGLSNSKTRVDSCPTCLQPVSHVCISLLHQRWHPPCFECTKCKGKLEVGSIHVDQMSLPYCNSCGTAMERSLASPVTDLEQWVFLIRHSLAQACFELGFIGMILK